MKDTNHHQRYNLYGIHDTPLVRQAVQETAGVFLSFNKLPALTMFDSCCGGLIPAHIADFDFVRAPYLARPYACTFCKNCSLYEWEVKYESAVLEQLLRSQLATLQKMTDVKIHKKDKAGIVQEVAIIQRGKPPVTLSGKKIYSLDKNIKSFSFNIQKKGGVWWLRGKGFGHHLGLCQWGARQMVKEGWNYRAILHYYYPGTSFSRITA